MITIHHEEKWTYPQQFSEEEFYQIIELVKKNKPNNQSVINRLIAVVSDDSRKR